MKKVIVVVMMVVAMIAMMNCANAQDYTEIMNKLYNYLDENNLTEKFNETVDEYGIFGYAGGLNMEYLTKEYEIKDSWNDKDIWFRDWYEAKLEERYPEYGDVAVVFTKEAVIDGVQEDYLHLQHS